MKWFTMNELCASDTASKKGIANKPGEAEKARLEVLTERVLDPLREAYGKPIKVNSGYRCEALNKAVGGARTSHHVKGMAADIAGTPNTKAENRRLFELVQELGLPFTQLIDEKAFSWVHVSLDEGNVKKQVLHL